MRRQPARKSRMVRPAHQRAFPPSRSARPSRYYSIATYLAATIPKPALRALLPAPGRRIHQCWRQLTPRQKVPLTDEPLDGVLIQTVSAKWLTCGFPVIDGPSISAQWLPKPALLPSGVNNRSARYSNTLSEDRKSCVSRASRLCQICVKPTRLCWGNRRVFGQNRRARFRCSVRFFQPSKSS